MKGLSQKVIIVAGGASGIGAATVRRLAEEGACVVIGDRSEDAAAALAENLAGEGGTVRSFGFDIRDPEGVDGLVAFAIEAFGRLDGLHNNVADLRVQTFGADTNILDVDIDVWNRTLQINLTGMFLMMRRAIPELLKAGGGSIVNTSSGAAAGSDRQPSYGASKAAVNSLTRHVALAFGRQGIRCNCVVPGAIPTSSARNLIQQAGHDVGAHYRDIRETYLRSARDGTPDDVASMIAFLMSEDGSWINGQILKVDGGWILG